jgi:hypothetical protein
VAEVMGSRAVGCGMLGYESAIGTCFVCSRWMAEQQLRLMLVARW